MSKRAGARHLGFTHKQGRGSAVKDCVNAPRLRVRDCLGLAGRS